MFELEAYWENGHATHANASAAASGGPPNRRPTSASPIRQIVSNRIEVRCTARQPVPLVAPAEDRVARDVREVGDRPVGVAERVRGLAPAVRLDPVAHLAFAVGRAALRPRVLDREVAVGALAVHDPVGADDPGVADVDHVRRAHVEPDAKPGDEHRRRGEQPDGPDRHPARRRVAARDPETAQQQPARAAGRRAASPRRRGRG